MAYALYTDVQSVLGSKVTLTTTSKPSQAEVTAWLARAAADLDSALTTGGYPTIPLTGENDLAIAKDYTANYGALRTVITAWSGDVPTSLKEAWGGWREWLDLLRKGAYWFPDSGQPSRPKITMMHARVYGSDDD